MTKPLEIRERDIQAQTVQYFRWRGVILDRHAVGCYKSIDGKRYVTVGKKGDPDLVGSIHGKRLWIEIKAPRKRPTRKQIERMVHLNLLGEIALWIDGIDYLPEIYRLLDANYTIEMDIKTGDYVFVLPMKGHINASG